MVRIALSILNFYINVVMYFDLQIISVLSEDTFLFYCFTHNQLFLDNKLSLYKMMAQRLVWLTVFFFLSELPRRPRRQSRQQRSPQPPQR